MNKQSSRAVGQLYTTSSGGIAVSRRGLRRYPARPDQTLTILVRPGLLRLEVSLHNVGANGLAFRNEQPLPLDAVLALQSAELGRGASWIRSGRILHCNPSPEGGFLVGVEVSPHLTADELDRLIDPQSRA